MRLQKLRNTTQPSPKVPLGKIAIRHFFCNFKTRSSFQPGKIVLVGSKIYLPMDTIIIQDTDEAIRDVLTIALSEENFIVYPVEYFQDDFLDLIDRLGPNLLILDFVLGGERSGQICRAVKRRFGNLPVLAMSCNSRISELYASYGFDGYLAKPFDLNGLIATLRSFISRAGYKPRPCWLSSS